jgi:hypothetical protein
MAELRVRLAPGDFHGQRDLWLGNELTLSYVELAGRDLLREVDEYAALPPEQREQYPWKGRRLQRLLESPASE